MKKEIFKEIEIPEGVKVEVNEKLVEVNGPEGKIERSFRIKNLQFKKENNKVIIGHKKATKREKKSINTISAHIRNMINGVQKKFEYTLKICFSHFPFTVSISGNKVEIKNFLGEKVPRIFYIPEGVEIKIDKEYVIVISCDKELVGRVASSLERTTKIKGRDKRIFQDGLYIINKLCGGRK